MMKFWLIGWLVGWLVSKLGATSNIGTTSQGQLGDQCVKMMNVIRQAAFILFQQQTTSRTTLGEFIVLWRVNGETIMPLDGIRLVKS
jgi:hypothetical protein